MKGSYELTVLLFSDASRMNPGGQIGYISGLLLGEFKKGPVFHTLSWMSRKSPRPVRSIGSAETIAAGFVIDEEKFRAKSYEELLGTNKSLEIAVDSLTTCHEPHDKSVSADLKVIRFEFETKKVTWTSWVPGKLNLADPLTKKDSSMVQPLQLLMYTGTIPKDLSQQKTRVSTQSTG